jgi:rod shape-determining protein MreD
MKRPLVYLITILLLLSLNIVWPGIKGAVPNFLFLLVVFSAFKKDDADFIWVAFFSGLLLDSSSHIFFGSYTISFLLVALMINYATRIFFKKDISIPLMILIVGFSFIVLVSLVYFMSSMTSSYQHGTYVLPIVYLTKKIWFDLILNIVFAAPIYFLLVFIERNILKSEV